MPLQSTAQRMNGDVVNCWKKKKNDVFYSINQGRGSSLLFISLVISSLCRTRAKFLLFQQYFTLYMLFFMRTKSNVCYEWIKMTQTSVMCTNWRRLHHIYRPNRWCYIVRHLCDGEGRHSPPLFKHTHTGQLSMTRRIAMIWMYTKIKRAGKKR